MITKEEFTSLNLKDLSESQQKEIVFGLIDKEAYKPFNQGFDAIFPIIHSLFVSHLFVIKGTLENAVFSKKDQNKKVTITGGKQIQIKYNPENLSPIISVDPNYFEDHDIFLHHIQNKIEIKSLLIFLDLITREVKRKQVDGKFLYTDPPKKFADNGMNELPNEFKIAQTDEFICKMQIKPAIIDEENHQFIYETLTIIESINRKIKANDFLKIALDKINATLDVCINPEEYQLLKEQQADYVKFSYEPKRLNNETIQYVESEAFKFVEPSIKQIRESIHFLDNRFLSLDRRKDLESRENIIKGSLDNAGFGFNVKIGVEITQTQARVKDALLLLFEKTNYKGNMPAYLLTDEDRKRQNTPVKQLPMIKFSKKELFNSLEEWGIKIAGGKDEKRYLEALEQLATQQFYYQYEYLIFDKTTKKPKFDPKSKKYKTGLAEGITTLFSIEANKEGETKEYITYFTCVPCPMLIHQIGIDNWDSHNIGNYYALKPITYIDEFKKIGGKKLPELTLNFADFIFGEFEKRRRQEAKGHNISYTLNKDIAYFVKMLGVKDESIKKDRKYYTDQLKDTLSIAKRAGYLSAFRVTAEKVTYTMNKNKFIPPQSKEDRGYYEFNL